MGWVLNEENLMVPKLMSLPLQYQMRVLKLFHVGILRGVTVRAAVVESVICLVLQPASVQRVKLTVETLQINSLFQLLLYQ